MSRVRHVGWFFSDTASCTEQAKEQLREKAGLDSQSFSPMLVNCCAASRNATYIGRRSLPSAFQQVD